MIDEYTHATLRATELNQMCDGTYAYPTKGGSAIQLSNPYMIICANAPACTVYPNAHPFILARFQ